MAYAVTMSPDNIPYFGGRELKLGGHAYEVIALAGEPTNVILKDAQAWAVREELPGCIWYGEAVHVGAEPLDEELADRVYREATPRKR
jgi:hypothetical protein